MIRRISANIVSTIDNIVTRSLPEFLDHQSRQETTKRRAGAAFRSYIRHRTNNNYECLFFQIDPEDAGFSVSVQIAASVFPECPIPSGAFGDDWPLAYALREVGIDVPRLTYYHLPDVDESILTQHLQVSVRQRLDKWAQILSADPVLKRLLDLLDGIDPLDPDCRSRLESDLTSIAPETYAGYSIPKVVHQALARKKGIKHWSQL